MVETSGSLPETREAGPGMAMNKLQQWKGILQMARPFFLLWPRLVCANLAYGKMYETTEAKP